MTPRDTCDAAVVTITVINTKLRNATLKLETGPELGAEQSTLPPVACGLLLGREAEMAGPL